jgi:hypothetical protein
VGISSARSRLGTKFIVVASISLTFLGNVHGQGSLDLKSDIPKFDSPRSTSTLRLLCRTSSHIQLGSSVDAPGEARAILVF